MAKLNKDCFDCFVFKLAGVALVLLSIVNLALRAYTMVEGIVSIFSGATLVLVGSMAERFNTKRGGKECEEDA